MGSPSVKEDFRPKTLKEKLQTRSNPYHIVVLNGLEKMLIFLFVKLFGRFAYDKKYLSGIQFERFWSPGWRRAYSGIFSKLFLGVGRGVPWPISNQTTCTRNIEFDIDCMDNFWENCYYQAIGGAKITLGKKTQIARGCALITSNHDLYNPEVHSPAQDIVIGDYCWLGSNVVITPGVVLGNHTVVAANAVVTKSYEHGYCVLGGVPARVIKPLDKEGFTNE